MTAETTLTVRSPADLIAAVPYLIGFHPVDSLTVVAVRGHKVVFAARHDLPAPGTSGAQAAGEARHLAAVVTRQEVDGATVIGYGEAARVTATVLRVSGALRDLGVDVLDELRVTDGRYWSYLCQDPACCPPDGLPCDPASAVAAAATYAGQVALPDRESLADRLAPVTGALRDGMRAATQRAQQRLADLLEHVPAKDGPSVEEAFARLVRRTGRAAAREAVARHRAGGRLTDDEVAWLGVLLVHLPVRDYAWERTGAEEWHVALWTDVVRRVEPSYVPGPACLLAFAAWRAGHGALASVAVERARAEDADYPMAVLLEDVLRYALPPASIDADWPVHRRRRSGRRNRRRRS